MTPKEFAKYLKRDGACYHCGTTDDTLIPQHRANRGAGGSKIRDKPANIIVFCSAANGLLESDAILATQGRAYFWKLYTWQDPELEPVYEAHSGLWWLLGNDYNRKLYEPGVK
jgi:hypothetical protein